MRVKEIYIRNVLGVSELEIAPGMVTRIMGSNGEGKTSVIEAIRSVIEGGHDASLVRKGESVGEVVLVLDDGMTITKRMNGERSTVKVQSPIFGSLSKGQSVIDTLMNRSAANPVAFITMPAKKRTEYLLEMCPMTVSLEALSEATGGLVVSTPGEHEHGLDVIAGWRKTIYDLRTEVNGDARGKKATIEQIKGSLPADENEYKNSHQAEISELERRKGEYENEMRTKVAMVREERGYEIDQRAKTCEDAIANLGRCNHSRQEEISKEISLLEGRIGSLLEESGRITNDAGEGVKGIRKDCDTDVRAIIDRFEMSELEVTGEFLPLIGEVASKIDLLHERETQAVRHRNTAEIINGMAGVVVELESTSKSYTAMLDNLDKLKVSLLTSIPIPGIEIVDGEITCDGIPFDRLNTAKKVDIAFNLARLSLGSLPIMFVDNAECLDTISLQYMEQKAIEEGVQLIYARVQDSALSITTSGEEVV